MTRGFVDNRLGLILLLFYGALAASAISAPPHSAPPASGAQEPDPLVGVLDHMYNLEFEPARQLLEVWVKEHPNDLRAWSYLAESILDEEMLREGMLTTGAYVDRGEAFHKRAEPLQERFEEELFAPLNKALSLGEARLKQNPRDQEALYWTGVAHGTRAEFDFALVRKYVAAAHEGIAARKYEERLAELNPPSADPLLILGIADYALGSMPWYLKVFLSIAGFHGNRARGLAEMERASHEGYWAREDAKFVLIAIYRREKMYPKLYADLDDLARSFPRNYLVDLEKARVFKDEDRWRDAANVYDELVTRLDAKDPGGPPMPAPRILYLCGQAHERLGEREQALKLYERAGRLRGGSLDIYRASLAAAKVQQDMGQLSEARQNYQRVAQAVPDTEEGKAARRALKSLN